VNTAQVSPEIAPLMRAEVAALDRAHETGLFAALPAQVVPQPALIHVGSAASTIQFHLSSYK